MAIQTEDGRYKCSYCDKSFDDPFKADNCRESHDLIYVQLSRSDLNMLMQFIYYPDEEFLTETLVKALRKYV